MTENPLAGGNGDGSFDFEMEEPSFDDFGAAVEDDVDDDFHDDTTAIFDSIDTSGNGVVSFEEFAEWSREMQPGPVQSRIRVPLFATRTLKMPRLRSIPGHAIAVAIEVKSGLRATAGGKGA